jgi:hypothetical protein
VAPTPKPTSTTRSTTLFVTSPSTNRDLPRSFLILQGQPRPLPSPTRPLARCQPGEEVPSLHIPLEPTLSRRIITSTSPSSPSLVPIKMGFAPLQDLSFRQDRPLASPSLTLVSSRRRRRDPSSSSTCVVRKSFLLIRRRTRLSRARARASRSWTLRPSARSLGRSVRSAKVRPPRWNCVLPASSASSPDYADHDRNPRLIVVQASGLTRVFELANVGGGWHLSEKVVSFSHESVSGAFATFVLDKLGNELLANPSNLQHAVAHQASFSHDNIDVKGALTSLWITVNSSTVSAYFK